MSVTKTFGNKTGTDYSGCIDNSIYSWDPTANAGSDPTMYLFHSTVENRGLICFSGLSNIPAGATITAATLYWYLNSWASSGDTHILSLFRLLRNWSELQSTWNIYSTGNNWATAGGMGTGDSVATPTATTTLIDSLGWQSWSSAGLVSDIQNIVNGTANYGWLVQETVQVLPQNILVWITSNYAVDATLRPYLSVTYNLAPTGKIVNGVLCSVVNGVAFSAMDGVS